MFIYEQHLCIKTFLSGDRAYPLEHTYTSQILCTYTPPGITRYDIPLAITYSTADRDNYRTRGLEASTDCQFIV